MHLSVNKCPGKIEVCKKIASERRQHLLHLSGILVLIEVFPNVVIDLNVYKDRQSCRGSSCFL